MLSEAKHLTEKSNTREILRCAQDDEKYFEIVANMRDSDRY